MYPTQAFATCQAKRKSKTATKREIILKVICEVILTVMSKISVTVMCKIIVTVMCKIIIVTVMFYFI